MSPRAVRASFEPSCPRCGEDRPAYMMPQAPGYWCKTCFWAKPRRSCHLLRHALPCGGVIRVVNRRKWHEASGRLG